MAAFGHACRACFDEILSVLAILGGGAARLRLLTYGDYDTPRAVTAMSGYDGDASRLLRETRIGGGGDRPEAVKTALWQLLDAAAAPEGAAAAHAVLLFTDAPPHTAAPQRGGARSSPGHLRKERGALGEARFDWLALRSAYATHDIPVITFMPTTNAEEFGRFYSCLGPLVALQLVTPAAIAAAVVAAFSSLIGHPPELDDAGRPPPGAAALDVRTAAFDCTGLVEATLPLEAALQDGDPQALAAHAPTRLLGAALHDLPKLLQRDAAYRGRVMELLAPLLTPEHARCLMTNPMLGKIWRALSAFRRHDDGVAALCDAFSVTVQALECPDVKAWLASTYNRCAHLMPTLCTLGSHHFDFV